MQQALFTLCPLCQGRHFSLKYDLPSLKVFQCSSCTMTFLNPYTPPSEMVLFYSDKTSMAHANPRLSSYYENLEGSQTGRFYDQCIRKLSALIPGDGTSLLDVGCGNGYFLSRAKQQDWAVTGIEPSAENGRHAKENFNIDVAITDFESYPVGRTFDCVSLWDFIEHVSNPKEVLGKVKALLKPNGIILLATPDHFSLINFLDRKSTRLNSSHSAKSRMPSSA